MADFMNPIALIANTWNWQEMRIGSVPTEKEVRERSDIAKMSDREKVIQGLEFTKAMITFNPSTGEDIEPGNLNEADKTTYDACVGAIALLKEREAVEPYSHLTEDSDLYFTCGKCGHVIWYESYKHCPICGLKIAWNGEGR